MQKSVPKPEIAPQDAPPLVQPSKGDTLSLYLSINPVVVSSVLVNVIVKVQVLVYYISKVLIKAEMNYLEIHKYLYALVISDRKFRPYFHDTKLRS